MGVPTIGGETNFDARYNDNILVNAMCVGLVDANRIFTSAAKGVGLPVVYVGSKTGRDGIHGATMASAEFDDASEEKRPTVQVGDPFTEKLLLEACLELMNEDAIVAIQDMGAAGLTSSSVEMADKGGVGIDLNLDRVPCREEAMTAYEMLLSESQERMLMVLKPGAEPIAKRIFTKWELDFAVIGETTDTGNFVVRHDGVVQADIPLPALAHAAPLYERPWVARDPLPLIAPDDVKAPESILGALECLMGSAHLSSRRWIYEQYDHMVMADTVQRPGGDAGVVRVHGTDKGLAVSCDVTPRYCAADPFEGAKQAVAECWRNITATGAKPLGITDCLNFGNPERPEIMGEFVRAVEGMAWARRAPCWTSRSCRATCRSTTRPMVGLFHQRLPSAASGLSPISRIWPAWACGKTAMCCSCLARRLVISANRPICKSWKIVLKARHPLSISPPRNAPGIWCAALSRRMP
jgi:phosphoribosylformylglycinamidine synthase